MDVERLANEQNELIKTLQNTDPESPNYGKMVSNLQKLETVKLAEENARFERSFKEKQHSARVAEETRRLDLEEKIKIGQLDLERQDKLRRFELEKNRVSSELRVNRMEVKAKQAEMELDSLKFEFEKQRFDHDKNVQINKMELDGERNKAEIAELKSQVQRNTSVSSNIVVPIAQKVIPAVVGGFLGILCFREETIGAKIVQLKPFEVGRKMMN